MLTFSVSARNFEQNINQQQSTLKNRDCVTSAARLSFRKKYIGQFSNYNIKKKQTSSFILTKKYN